MSPPPLLAAGQPARVLRWWEAVCMVVGLVIGAGIFKTPSLVAQFTRDPGWLITAWIVGAAVSFTGALCYAELASAHPHHGGEYHFLTLAYGRRLSFLYAWTKTTVINPGSIADQSRFDCAAGLRVQRQHQPGAAAGSAL